LDNTLRALVKASHCSTLVNDYLVVPSWADVRRKPELNKAAAVEPGTSAGRDVSDGFKNATDHSKKTLVEPPFDVIKNYMLS